MAERPRGVARRVAWSATLTVVTLAMFETLAQLGGWLPEPVGLLALIVASCAFVGGSQGGVASAAICVLFAISAGRFGSLMFPLDPRHFARAAIAAYALPALAFLVGSLRIQAQNRLGRYNNARAEADALDQRYRDLIEGLGGICWLIGLPNLDVHFISGSAADRFGYPISRWLDGDRIWNELVHPDDRERVRTTLAAAELSGSPRDIEHRVITRSGHVLRVHTIVQVRRDETGRAAFLHGVTMPDGSPGLSDDVGRAVFQHLPDPVLVHDGSGRIVDANPAACTALGYARDDLLELGLADIGLDTTENRGAAEPVPAVLRRRDGKPLSLLLRVLPLSRTDRTLTVVHAAPGEAA